MPTHREFLLSTASATVLLTVGGCAALGGALDNAVESAAAVTCVFGDGMRLVAVAVKYRADVSAAVLEPSQYGVAWRTVERVYVAQSTAVSGQRRDCVGVTRISGAASLLCDCARV